MLRVQILSACFKRREVTLPGLDFILIDLEQGSQLFYLLLVAVIDPSGKFHNFCFEIDLGTDVTYTYKILRGVARNQNATFLLNKILEKNFGE